MAGISEIVIVSDWNNYPPKEIHCLLPVEKKMWWHLPHMASMLSVSTAKHRPFRRIIYKLTFRFKHIVLLYDADKTGIDSAMKHEKALSEYGVKRLVLPLSGEKTDKDITDYFRKGITAKSFDNYSSTFLITYIMKQWPCLNPAKLISTILRQSWRSYICRRRTSGNTGKYPLYHRRGRYGKKQLCCRTDCRLNHKRQPYHWYVRRECPW